MKTTIIKPVPGRVYAVHTGTYAGQMLLFIKTESVDYCFLSIPEMNNLTIPKSIFEHGLKNDIVKYAETVPSYVLKVSTAQYKQNERKGAITKYNKQQQA